MDSTKFDVGAALSAVSQLSDEDRRLLNAARDLVVTHGIKRTSIDDIARRAGVTRRTVNRRLGDKNRIVRTIVAREVMDFFAGSTDQWMGLDSPAERTVEAFVAGVVAFHGNPVAQAVLHFEPEIFGAFFQMRDEASWRQIIDVVALGLLGAGLGIEQARRLTELIFRITASLLIAPSESLPLQTASDARWFANSVFVPIVEHGLSMPAG